VGSPRVPGRPGVGVLTVGCLPRADGPGGARAPPFRLTLLAVFEWIEVFYNRQRIHTTLGGYAPEEFENLSLNQAREAA